MSVYRTLSDWVHLVSRPSTRQSDGQPEAADRVAPRARPASPRPLEINRNIASFTTSSSWTHVADGAGAPPALDGEGRRLKVCFLAYQGNMFTGGQGVYLYYLTRELARLGHEVHVIAGVPYPELDERVHLHRVKPFGYTSRWDAVKEYDETYPLQCFHPVNFYELVTTRYTLSSLLNVFSLRAYHLLNELEHDGAFDLIHDNQTLSYGVWMMKLRGRPVIATVHHPLSADADVSIKRQRSLRSRIGRIVWYPWVMQRRVAHNLDRLITVSEAAAQAVGDAFSLQRERLSVVPNGVDGDLFRPLGLPKEEGTLLFVGRTEDEGKGFAHLLEALKLLRGRVPFRLKVVTRPARERTEALVDKSGLYGRVEFLENLSTEQLIEEYNKAQIVVSPSLYEGFGLPAIEGLACGTPVVATNVGAFPSIIEHDETGLLVPPADARALSQAIWQLLENPDRCVRMGELGRQHVICQFSWRRAALETLQVYADAIASPRVVAAPTR
jgi:glycosyltransferase involved in cell wall biosynthesis